MIVRLRFVTLLTCQSVGLLFRARTHTPRLRDPECFTGGGGGTLYIGLYGETPPERGTFFRLQVYKRVGISQVEVHKRVGKSVVSQ